MPADLAAIFTEFGQTILVTDRGEPIAELRPVRVSDNAAEEAFRRMAAEGLDAFVVYDQRIAGAARREHLTGVGA